jgi:hypothetical protein
MPGILPQVLAELLSGLRCRTRKELQEGLGTALNLQKLSVPLMDRPVMVIERLPSSYEAQTGQAGLVVRKAKG